MAAAVEIDVRPVGAGHEGRTAVIDVDRVARGRAVHGQGAIAGHRRDHRVVVHRGAAERAADDGLSLDVGRGRAAGVDQGIDVLEHVQGVDHSGGRCAASHKRGRHRKNSRHTHPHILDQTSTYLLCGNSLQRS